MYAAHLCSTNEKMSKCKGRNSEAYSNLLPVFQFTLVFKGLFYTLIAMCSLNGRDISKITEDRFKHNFAWMHNQIDEKHGESPCQMHDGTEVQTKKWTTTWSWSRYFSVEAVLATLNFMGSFKLNCSSTERPKLTQDHRWIDKQSDQKTEVLLIRCQIFQRCKREGPQSGHGVDVLWSGVVDPQWHLWFPTEVSTSDIKEVFTELAR